MPWNLWRPSVCAAHTSSSVSKPAMYPSPQSAGSAIGISPARKRRWPSAGSIQKPSEASPPSRRGSCPAGTGARKKRAVKRIGFEGGVMKCER